MINSCTMVGRIARMPELLEDEHGSQRYVLLLEVERPFRNTRGQYDSDVFPVELWRGSAEMTKDHCQVGAYIGLRGRLENVSFLDREGKKEERMEIIAEKISFLSAVILHGAPANP